MKKPDDEKNDAGRFIAEVRHEREQREKEYREQALRIYPHLCARCGRDFSGKKLRELTVHHKDHNHGNNPLDGSNWELLCLYCHDNEHQKYLEADSFATPPDHDKNQRVTYQPFSALADLLKEKKK